MSRGSRPEPKEKPCFYCDKKRFTHSAEADVWILNNAPLCNSCRQMLQIRCGQPAPEAKSVQTVPASDPSREPGEDG